MEIRQVQIALAVAKHMSFSEAAWKTSFSPSTVTKQVHALEQELGVVLFERNGRSKVALTEKGEKLLPQLESLANCAENLIRQAQQLRESDLKRIRIGCPNGLSTLGEDELLTDFNVINPDISIEQVVSYTSEMLSQMQYSALDAVFTLMDPEEFSNKAEAGVGSIVLGKLSLNIALRANHKAIENGKVKLSKLADEVFLFRKFDKDMQKDSKVRYFDSACKKIGFEPKLQFLNMRNSAMFDMAAAGQGVIPLMHIPKTIYPGVEVLPVEDTDYTFYKVVYYRKNHQSPALKRFVEFLIRENRD